MNPEREAPFLPRPNDEIFERNALSLNSKAQVEYDDGDTEQSKWLFAVLGADGDSTKVLFADANFPTHQLTI